MKMRKNSKAMGIRKLLKKGYTPAQIKEHMDVSDSYIHAIKTRLAAEERAEEAETLTEAVKAKVGEYVVVEGAKSIQEIDAILNERGSRYGNFMDHATITYQLKQVARDFAAEKGKHFAYDQCEALDMIFHKLGRILNGDPNYDMV